MKIYQKFLFGFIVIVFSIIITIYTRYWLESIWLNNLWSHIYQRGCIGFAVSSFILLQVYKKPHHQVSIRQNHVISWMFILIISQLIYSLFLIVYDLLYTVFGQSVIIINYIGITATILFLLACLYGSKWGKYRYTVHKHTLFFKDLPATFEGFRILQISDIHSWSFDNEKYVTKGIELIESLQPDLFVFTWDLVNNDAYEFQAWKALFSRIRAPHGQYSILGNHDYWDYASWASPAAKHENLDSLKQHHKDIWWQLLLNEHVYIEKDGEHIILAWVENRGDGFVQHGDLFKALTTWKILKPSTDSWQLPFTVLLSHDPTHWVKVVQHYDKHVHLTLSGHTHGMQMGFDFSWLKRSPIKLRYKKWIGMYENKWRYLYINRGFGFLGLSARVGIWPEITVIELKKDSN